MDFMMFVGLTIIVAIISDLYFLSTWNLKYFRVGIPIIIKKLQLINIVDVDIITDKLSIEFKGNFWNRRLIFKGISECKIAFREEYSFFNRNAEIVHGLIMIDSKNHNIIIRGILNNGFLLLLIALFVFMSTSIFPVEAYIIMLVFIVGIYILSVHRYNKIRDYLEHIIKRT